MEDTEEYLEVIDLVENICSQCGIPTFPRNLSDDEIARVCRWVGEHSPNTKTIDGKLAISAEGFDTMMFITITEYPDFFEKNRLAMVWRN